MSNKISLVQGYLHYWLQAVNEHSLHAPFVYDFYTQVVKSMESPAGFGTIERLREQYLNSVQSIDVTDFGAGAGKPANRSVRSIAKKAIISPKYAALLYRCAKYAKANHTLELGTSLGISTMYLSAAAPQQKVYTIEGSPAIATLAKQAFHQWPYKNIVQTVGNIDDVLAGVLESIPSLDFLYLDANHRYEPTMRYFTMCKQKAHEHSIFILDDIYWSHEMRNAWKKIQHDKSVSLSLDLYQFGIVFFKKLVRKQHYALLF